MEFIVYNKRYYGKIECSILHGISRWAGADSIDYYL